MTGNLSSGNIGIDDNEIQARYGGSPTRLYLNNDGGQVSLCSDAGNVGIGLDNPEHKLHVNANGEYSAFVTRPASNHGPNRASIYGYRPGEGGENNGGTGLGVDEVDAAVKGYTYWGNMWTFGVAGYSYCDFPGSGGV